MKTESKFCDYEESGNKSQKSKECMRQKIDAKSMSFESTINSDKHKNKDSEENFDEVSKNNASCKVQLSVVKSSSLDKKADISTDDLVSEEIENKDNIVQTNVNFAAIPTTSHSSSESSKNKNEKYTENVDITNQTDENKTSINCNDLIGVNDFLKNRMKYFKNSSDYIVEERKRLGSDFEEIYTSNKSNKRNKIKSVCDKFCKRVDDVRKLINKQVIHGCNISELVSRICDIEQILWKEAASVIYPGRFSDASLENIWETLDWMKKLLDNVEEITKDFPSKSTLINRLIQLFEDFDHSGNIIYNNFMT